MREFIFIIPRTPKEYKTTIRESLWRITLQSLINQSYASWKAIVVCDDLDEPLIDNRIIYLKSSVQKKGEKINKAIHYVTSKKIKVDFVIRLDDDDLIMPTTLEDSLKFNFDVYADRYHTFYDLSSGLLSIDKRKWFPNTVIHKVSHAFKICDDTGLHVINHDHSLKWHEYYKNKMIVYSKKISPVYIRVLNPVSVSASESNDYDNYLSFFGNWKYNAPESFMLYSKLLLNIQKENNLFIEHKRDNLLMNFKNKLLKTIFK
jgi:hypothetical protein